MTVRTILIPLLMAVSLALAFPAADALAQSGLGIDKHLGKVRGWRIGYSNSLNGCLARATYRDRTTVWFGYGEKLKFYVAFTNPNWSSFRKGEKYNLRIKLRGYGRWNGKFLGFERRGDQGLIIASLKKKFMVGFAKAGGIRVRRGRRKVTNLSLNGSRKALLAVLSCEQSKHLYASARVRPRGVPNSTRTSKRNRKKQGSSSGTGFFVSSSGHVLTNHHVVKGCRTLKVIPVGQLPRVARVLASDRRNDLAVLVTDIKPRTVPAFRSRIRVGESVYVYGFPLSSLLATTGNFTIGNVTAVAGMQDDISQVQISAPVQPGNSGGPLLDKYGNVIGVIVSKLNALRVARITKDVTQNVNFAIKATIAGNFLETNDLSPPDGASKQPMASEDIAARAKEFTVRIKCN